MRSNWIKQSATGGSGALTLSAVSGFAAFSDVFGTSGSRAVEYEIDDGAGNFEAGIGSIALATGVLTRQYPIFTRTSAGAYKTTAVIALTFSGTVNVRCSPLASDASHNSYFPWDSLGDGIASPGDPALGGYANASVALATGFICCRPFIWRGTRSITKATMRCATLAATAKMLAGIYEPTDHNTATLRLDLSNGGNGFDGTATGVKTLTSGGGNFTEILLPVGEYIVAFLQLGGNAAWNGTNKDSILSSILGFTNGVPVGQAISASGQTSLPTTLGSGGTSLSSSTDWQGGNLTMGLYLGW